MKPKSALPSLCDHPASRTARASFIEPEKKQLTNETLRAMLRDEDYSLIRVNSRASFLPYRSYLIRMVRSLVAKMQLARPTYFLALNYIDDLLAKTVVPKRGLKLAAVCCLYLAGIIDMEHSIAR